MVYQRREGLYTGLILIWALPFQLLLWYGQFNQGICIFKADECRTLAYQFILGLPLSSTLAPIAVPTVYLWAVDTLALKRGTWVIESGTKLGWHLWDGLEIESVHLELLEICPANDRAEKQFSSC